MERRGKSAFFRPAFWAISSVFSLIYLVFLSIKFSVFSPSVTLVTAKNQHRCWKARAHTRTHEKTRLGYFVRLTYQFLHINKIKCHFFAIFSLFGDISTHIHIGVHP